MLDLLCFFDQGVSEYKVEFCLQNNKNYIKFVALYSRNFHIQNRIELTVSNLADNPNVNR